MKKVININLSGRVIPIEDAAYESLQRYIDSLRRHFSNEEGRDEIINDIESRIAELFDGELKKGSTVITDSEVAAVINSIGRPEDFEAEETAGQTAYGTSAATDTGTSSGTGFSATVTGKRLYRDENNKVIGGVCSGLGNYFNVDPVVVRVIFVISALFFGIGIFPYIILWIAVPSTASKVIGSIRKKLYRDSEDKILGGVSSGMGHYFGINAWIPRVLFLLPFVSIVLRWGNWGMTDFSFPQLLSFSFSPGAMIVYIIFWLVVPEAVTTAEKLEMKGEKVDLNSIKNSVVEEMKGVHQRAEKMGREARSFAEEKSRMIKDDVTAASKRSRGKLGNIIVFIVKMFLYFILGVIAISLIIGLFSIAIVAIGIFPLKDYILNDGWQNAFAWGTLIFFIGVPIIAVITWIIRRLARIKTKNRLMRLSFLALWFLGVFSFIGLLVTVGKDFRTTNSIFEEEVPLVNPAVSRLEVSSQSPFQRFDRNKWFQIEPFGELFEDTAYVRNVNVHLIKADGDSFRVTVTKMVRGSTRRFADTLASKLYYKVEQKDSLLITDKGIGITKKDKFRNQQVILTIYVPVGKIININRNVGWSHSVRFGGPWNDEWSFRESGNVEHGWDLGVDYIMREDGLYTLDGQPADTWKNGRRMNRNRDDLRDDAGDDVRERRLKLQEELKELERRERLDSLQRLTDSVRTGRIDLYKLLHDKSKGGQKVAEKPKNSSLPLMDGLSPLIM